MEILPISFYPTLHPNGRLNRFMAPFSIPAPHICPLQAPANGTRRTIDTQTQIELACETHFEHEIFFTLDGTRPQPYAGIVQGSKLFKYSAPFCLPPGKVSVKAIALNAQLPTMRSNIVTKCFEVLKVEVKQTAKKKKRKKPRVIVTELDISGSLFDINKCDNKSSGDDCDDVSRKLFLEEPVTGVENIPAGFEVLVDEDDVTSECSESERARTSVQDNDDLLNIATCESAKVTPLSSTSSSPIKKPLVDDIIEDEIRDNKQVFNKSCDIVTESPPRCTECESSLQKCKICTTVNTITSKYCIQCGTRLKQQCDHCKELNYVVATFCQFCGQKLQVPSELIITSKDDCVVPKMLHKSLQNSPFMINQQTQTSAERKSIKTPQKTAKNLLSRSPGRGYWHQQVDYICNHLKSFAYNNKEFRDSVSEPVLSDFQAAKVTKNEDCISITLTFTPFRLNEKQ